MLPIRPKALFVALVLAGLAPATLTGCAGGALAPLLDALPEVEIGWPRAAAPVETPRAEAKPLPLRKAESPRKPAAATPAVAPATEPQPARTAVARPPRLLGLSEGEIVALIGQPTSEATAPPGKVWQYASGSCRLEVYLFPDVSHGGFRALELRSPGADEISPEQCLIRLLPLRPS